MACNTCSKTFSLLRKEKGCPGCGFSYCSKCLDNKVFLQKVNAEVKVCGKCKKLSDSIDIKPIEPPDAYYKRVGMMNNSHMNSKPANANISSSVDKEIHERLAKLKEDRVTVPSEDEIATRLKNIKREMPSTSDAELRMRLAKLKGAPEIVQSKLVLPAPDTRSEQEQADDLLKQYMEQTKMDKKYKDEFDAVVSGIESRLHKLKGSSKTDEAITTETVDSEDEEKTVKQIIEKMKAEALLEDNEISPTTNDELPFCEICNEDARMRCLGCKYLFCKRCFLEHKDDDHGCNQYEPYTPPRRSS